MEQTKNYFEEMWDRYFPNCELPIVSYFSDQLNGVDVAEPLSPEQEGHTCVFRQLEPVRSGGTLALDKKTIGCTGFSSQMGFSYDEEYLEDDVSFLCDMVRYKKSHELFEQTIRPYPFIAAPGKYIIFKRWDLLNENDTPEIVNFFANPDALTGLYMLANYDEPSPFGVVMPWGPACSSMVNYPMRELDADNPKSFLGGFDPTARCTIEPADTLIFSVPWPKFMRMLENMEASFLSVDLASGEAAVSRFASWHDHFVEANSIDDSIWKGIMNRLADAPQ
ncbi:MAG: DUF169 domain-containing protein [Desulfobacter sp.]